MRPHCVVGQSSAVFISTEKRRKFKCVVKLCLTEWSAVCVSEWSFVAEGQNCAALTRLFTRVTVSKLSDMSWNTATRRKRLHQLQTRQKKQSIEKETLECYTLSQLALNKSTSFSYVILWQKHSQGSSFGLSSSRNHVKKCKKVDFHRIKPAVSPAPLQEGGVCVCSCD